MSLKINPNAFEMRTSSMLVYWEIAKTPKSLTSRLNRLNRMNKRISGFLPGSSQGIDPYRKIIENRYLEIIYILNVIFTYNL